MSVIERHPTDHVVIAGFGSSGSEAAVDLIRRGADPDTIVVVDDNAEALRSAEALGVTVMEGNATRDAALEAARASTAGALIVAAGRDHTSILIAPTARRSAPTLPISAVVGFRDNEEIARQAGANTVINPASFCDCSLRDRRTVLTLPTIWPTWRHRTGASPCASAMSSERRSARNAFATSIWAAKRWNMPSLGVPGLPIEDQADRPNLSQRRALVIAALLRDQGIAPVARPAAGQRFSLTPGTAVTP
jgi:hypothetical protein